MGMLQKYRTFQVRRNHRPPRGIVLILVLVILVVLSTVVYTLTSRVAAYKDQQQYRIDYQNARYACDSALKHSLATIQDLKLTLPTRETVPDFSDLFAMEQEEYELLLEDWAEQIAEEQAEAMMESEEQFGRLGGTGFGDTEGGLLGGLSRGLSGLFGFGDEGDMALGESSDPNGGGLSDPNSRYDFYKNAYAVDANELEIPGPYGPPWPFVTDPIELEIEGTDVVIEITDENARMPLTWAITDDQEVNEEAAVAMQWFCAWMEMDKEETENFLTQLKEIENQKTFKLKMDRAVITEKTPPEEKKDKKDPRSRLRRRTSRRRTSRRRSPTVKKKVRPEIAHTTDFAKLLHSPLLDREVLARPLEDRGERYESALKYLALWGSQQVNINTAPRHVLEAAFSFGGNADDIAQEIIVERRLKPFKSIDDLKERLYHQSNYIEKAEPYITNESTFLAIRVTATRGNARSTSVATVIKEKNKVEKIGVMSY